MKATIDHANPLAAWRKPHPAWHLVAGALDEVRPAFAAALQEPSVLLLLLFLAPKAFVEALFAGLAALVLVSAEKKTCSATNPFSELLLPQLSCAASLYAQGLVLLALAAASPRSEGPVLELLLAAASAFPLADVLLALEAAALGHGDAASPSAAWPAFGQLHPAFVAQVAPALFVAGMLLLLLLLPAAIPAEAIAALLGARPVFEWLHVALALAFLPATSCLEHEFGEWSVGLLLPLAFLAAQNAALALPSSVCWLLAADPTLAVFSFADPVPAKAVAGLLAPFAKYAFAGRDGALVWQAYADLPDLAAA